MFLYCCSPPLKMKIIMKNELPLISSRRLHSIRTQGYCDYSDANLSELAFGNRFAYYLCSFFLLIRSDYSQYHGSKRNDGSFNILLSKPLNKPELPRRSKQLKFACIVIYNLVSNYNLSVLFRSGISGICVWWSSVFHCIFGKHN